MARPRFQDLSPWRRRQLTIPPDSLHAWVTLVFWEFWMGVLVCAALGFGTKLIVTAPDSIVTVFDLSGCYSAPPIEQPCERVAFKAGALSVAFNLWCGVLLIAVAAWLLWELWSAVAPKPITDDFLKLLNDSFARNWRDPRTWPWSRMFYAYAFALVGVGLTVAAGLGVQRVIADLRPLKPAVVKINTSQDFRVAPQ